MQIALIACSWVILGPFFLMAQEADLSPAPVLDAVSVDITIQVDGETYQIVEGDPVAKRQDDAPGNGDAGEKPEEVDVDPRIAALEQQFRPHVKRLVQVELQFLRAVCRPSAQEFRNVKKGVQAAASMS